MLLVELMAVTGVNGAGWLARWAVCLAALAVAVGLIDVYAAGEHGLMVGERPGRTTRHRGLWLLDRLLPAWLVRARRRGSVEPGGRRTGERGRRRPSPLPARVGYRFVFQGMVTGPAPIRAKSHLFRADPGNLAQLRAKPSLLGLQNAVETG